MQGQTFDAEAIVQSVRRQIEAEYAEKWRLAAQAIGEAERLKARLLDEADIITLRLAFEVSKKVIRREATVNPDIVIYNIREALRLLRDSRSLTLQLHPDDLKTVQGDDIVRQELERKTERLELKANSDIQRGGCLLETDDGFIDARVESQIAEIERLVAEATE